MPLGASGTSGRSHRVKIDTTVNVPTMITILTIAVGSLTAGFRTVNEIDQRLARADFEIATLKEKIRSAETTIAATRIEQTSQTQSLRLELRNDLSEISRKLDNLVFQRQR
jgi:hypothetical protein